MATCNATRETSIELEAANGHYAKHELEHAEYNSREEEEERLLLSSIDVKGSRSRRSSVLKQCCSVKVILLVSTTLLLLLGMGLAVTVDDELNTEVSGRLSALRTKINRLAGEATSTCRDPWAAPGYIWYGDHRFDARWISYKDFPEDVLQLNASQSIDPVTMGAKPGSKAPHADKLPLQYTKLFSQAHVRKNNSDLEFLRNKHIVVLGSSMDREAIMMFCNAYEGVAPAVLKWHHSLMCRFPDYNLTISQWMHFGMAQAPWFHGSLEYSKATSFEERLEQDFKPMADKIGKPDLLVFTSGFWDTQYFDQHLRKIDKSHPVNRQYPLIRPDQLKWHRARLVQAIEYLRTMFPETFLMYRTTTEPERARTDGDEEATAVFQLNQSAKIVMRMLKVPLFHWSQLVKGNHEHRDEHHFQTVSRANAVYHEMLFWHLKQISEPAADTSCWLDRG